MISEKQRVLRAAKLVYLLDGMDPPAAWRAANPEANCTDANAARAVRREREFLRSLVALKSPQLALVGDLSDLTFRLEMLSNPYWKQLSRSPTPAEAAPKKKKMCLGTATKRRCRKMLSPGARKRCPECSAEQRRLNQNSYSRNGYRKHKPERNKKRRERYQQKKQDDLRAAKIATVENTIWSKYVVSAISSYSSRRLGEPDYMSTPLMTVRNVKPWIMQRLPVPAQRTKKPRELYWYFLQQLYWGSNFTLPKHVPAQPDARLQGLSPSVRRLISPDQETVGAYMKRMGFDPQEADHLLGEIIERVKKETEDAIAKAEAEAEKSIL